MTDVPKRILIIRLSAVGDVLRALPALKVLKKNYPDSHIAWVVEESSRDILEAHPDIDQVIIFPKKKLLQKFKSRKQAWQGVKELMTFIKELRNKRFDLTIDFHGLFKSGIISYCSGAPERTGFTRPYTKEGNFIFNNRRFGLESKRLNRIERNLALLKNMGLPIDHQRPGIHTPQADQEVIAAFFEQERIDPQRPLIAIHPGTSPTTPYKRWDPFRYAVVADKIIEDNAAQIIFTWAREELAIVNEITGLMKHRAIIAPETQNLCQLAEIFRSSDLYLGSDTGPMHLASFVGIPIVALFGPTDVAVNEPYRLTPHIIIKKETECSPCRKKNCRKRLCMKHITEDSVIRGVNIMLDSIKNTGGKNTEVKNTGVKKLKELKRQKLRS